MEGTNNERNKSFYTTNELAELAGVDPSRIRQLLIEDKELRGRKHGFMWLIPAPEAQRWLEGRKSNKH